MPITLLKRASTLPDISLETIEEIKNILRSAGDIALKRRQLAQIRLKPDNTPYTDVELEMEACIIPFLQTNFPEAQIISEESGVFGNTPANIWALDPVDGTKVFLNGLPNWGVSLGLLENGHPKLGFFYMPATGDFYWGGDGYGAHLNDIDLQTIPRLAFDSPLAFLAVPANVHRHFNLNYPSIRCFGSTAAHMCYVAQGIAVGAITRRVNLWDLAGVLPILQQAGIQVEFLTRGTFSAADYLTQAKFPEEILASPPEYMPLIRAGLHPKPARNSA